MERVPPSGPSSDRPADWALPCMNCGQGHREHQLWPTCRACGAAYDWLRARKAAAGLGEPLPLAPEWAPNEPISPCGEPLPAAVPIEALYECKVLDHYAHELGWA